MRVSNFQGEKKSTNKNYKKKRKPYTFKIKIFFEYLILSVKYLETLSYDYFIVCMQEPPSRMLSTDVTGQFMNMLLCQGSFIQNKTVKSLSAVPGVKFHKNDKPAKRCLYVSFSAAHQNPHKKHAQSCSCTAHMCKHTLKYTNTHRLIERQSLSHEKCY